MKGSDSTSGLSLDPAISGLHPVDDGEHWSLHDVREVNASDERRATDDDVTRERKSEHFQFPFLMKMDLIRSQNVGGGIGLVGFAIGALGFTTGTLTGSPMPSRHSFRSAVLRLTRPLTTRP